MGPGESVYGVYLHPRWGDLLTSRTIATVTGGRKIPPWPDDAPSGVAYACSVVNISDASMSGIVVPLAITFESGQATVRRTIKQITLPVTLQPSGAPFKFYLVDDTGWQPAVMLPSAGEGRYKDESRNRLVTFTTPAAYGKPSILRGFGR
jgi:hypothetical protein